MKDLSLLDLETVGQIEVESAGTSFKQLGILVLDGSGSMVNEENLDKIPKGKAVSQAVRGLFNRLKDSRVADSFCFSVIYYDEKAKLVMDITDVKDINCEQDFNPTNGMGGLTYIYKGLEEAKKVADRFFAAPNPQEVPRTAVIVILSDGVDMKQDEAKRVLAKLKKDSRISVATCFFETLGAKKAAMKECQQYMEGLASKPTLYQSVATTEGLRKFFTASVSGILDDDRFTIR
jgi:uncharacterized protein YegL